MVALSRREVEEAKILSGLPRVPQLAGVRVRLSVWADAAQSRFLSIVRKTVSPLAPCSPASTFCRVYDLPLACTASPSPTQFPPLAPPMDSEMCGRFYGNLQVKLQWQAFPSGNSVIAYLTTILDL